MHQKWYGKGDVTLSLARRSDNLLCDILDSGMNYSSCSTALIYVE